LPKFIFAKTLTKSRNQIYNQFNEYIYGVVRLKEWRRREMFKGLKRIVVSSKKQNQGIVVGQRMQCRTLHKRKDC
jgi:hypothetical protein